MGISKNIADVPHEVDIIISGGGTAGCIVAGRLAQADPSLSILVIERGPDSYNVPEVTTPARFLENVAPKSKTAVFYKANRAKQLADRDLVVPSGGTLGGGSSINFMMYTRAQGCDFDSWETPGWSADDLIPYLKKFETYHGDDPTGIHGKNGPVNISDGTFRATVSESDFIRAAKEVGWPEINDLQDLTSNNGFQRWKRYVSPDGKRQDSAHRYLHPLIHGGKHPNLHVLVETKVVRILFDQKKRAVGVECTPNSDFQAAVSLSSQPKQEIRAKRTVVVSSGAIATPTILERSGVGDPVVLGRAGIPTLVDLPGVGRDYQDHNLLLYPFRTNLHPSETLDGLHSGRISVEKAMEEQGHLLGWNGVDISAKLRPSEEDIATLGAEFKKMWDRDFAPYPERPIMLMGLISAFIGDHSTIPAGQYVTIANYTAYPYSRGHIHITGPDIEDELDFDVGYLTDEHGLDLKKQVWAYKKAREIMRRTEMFRGELDVGHPRFPASSAAACVQTDTPLSNVSDIKYSAEDDHAIESWIREKLETTWHSLGTARMAPRENFGVVDKDLNVYGTTALKIADLSIPPVNVAANTNNTALMIGEKAADIIIKELGLEIVAN